MLRKSKTGYKFRRQAALGPYIADFLCPKLMIIIEVDGGSHSKWQQTQHDLRRNNYLRKHGYKIMRIVTDRIKTSLPNVIKEITQFLTVAPTLSANGPTSYPPPKGGEKTQIKEEANPNLLKSKEI